MAANGNDQVQEILENYPGIFEILEGKNKLNCKLTGHDIPCNKEALQSYINGKKFQALSKKIKSTNVINLLEKYQDYFIPSKKSPSRLYCKLTGKEINKLPHEIERYVSGYKFLKAVHKDHERKKETGLKTESEISDVNTEMENEQDEIGEDEIPFFIMSSEDEQEENLYDDPCIEEEKVKGDEIIPMESVELTKEENIIEQSVKDRKKRKLKSAKPNKKKKLKLSS